MERLIAIFQIAVVFVGTMAGAGVAFAAYPERPVHIVVPYAAGGSTDIAARIIGSGLSARLNVPVIIDNKPGAGGDIGAEYVARTLPDGYTLLFTGSALATAASLKNIPYNPRTDFAPITKALQGYYSILVNPSSQFKTLNDILTYARENPGKLDVACSGALTTAQFALEAFKSAAKVDFQIIYFNGNAPANLAVANGSIPVGLDAAFSARGLVDSGTLRMVAVTGPEREKTLPQIPTVAESGLPGFQYGFALGFFAPGKTPPDIVAKLNAELVKVIQDSTTTTKFGSLGMTGIGNSVAEFTAEFRNEIDQDAKIVEGLRASGALKD